MNKPLIVIVFFLLTAMGCSQEEDAVLPADPTQLVGEWVLVSPKTDYPITLVIEPDSTFYTANIIPPPIFMISGKGPVNQYGAVLNYAPKGVKSDLRWIVITKPFVTTKIAENAAQIKESADYLRRLGSSYKYGITAGGQLRLHYIAPWSSAKPVAGDDGTLIYQRQ